VPVVSAHNGKRVPGMRGQGPRWSRPVRVPGWRGRVLMGGALLLFACRLVVAVVVAVVVVVGSLGLGVAPAAVAVPVAGAARTFSLNETGALHMTSKHNFTLNEQGSASGTITGTIYVHLTVVSSSRVTAEVNIYPRGGSITGYGVASYRRGSTMATFSGSASIGRGTGSYAHAHGSGLSFSGTIARAHDAITVHMSGTVSD
jgi:hypothetical protein